MKWIVVINLFWVSTEIDETDIGRIAKIDLRFCYILRETEISVAYKVKKKSIRKQAGLFQS
ncbi:MAG: hypothetical protein DWQ02_24850 [Bacteroidetes bacterium]|nr:MAG: hypothetical protein DWQ02_24850 [Bacteroidota bacterium]